SGPPRRDLPAHARARRSRSPPHRRGPVQGSRPGAARRLRGRPPGDRGPVHQGSTVSTTPEPPREGESPEDIDAEFARLTQGLSLDEAPLTVEDVLAAPSAASEPEAAEEEPA